MLESAQMADSLTLIVRDASGKIKTTRYIKPYSWGTIEFTPNSLYLSLINQGFIEPNTWKIPFLFGSYKFSLKETSHGNS